jgi:hypothetical protein
MRRLGLHGGMRGALSAAVLGGRRKTRRWPGDAPAGA